MRYSFHLATFASRSIRAPPSPLVKPEPFVRPFVIPVRKERRPFTRPFVLPRMPLTSPFVRPRVPLTSPFVRPRVPLTSPFVLPRVPFTRPFVRPGPREGASLPSPFVSPLLAGSCRGAARGSDLRRGTRSNWTLSRPLSMSGGGAWISGSRFLAAADDSATASGFDFAAGTDRATAGSSPSPKRGAHDGGRRGAGRG